MATPGGKQPVVDQLSLGVKGGVLPPQAKKLRAELDRLAPVLAHPADLWDMDPDDFDVVSYSGGHGPMEDLAVDQTSGALLTKRLASGRPVALLCHAPAAALAASNPDGSWPFKGYNMTGLSNPRGTAQPVRLESQVAAGRPPQGSGRRLHRRLAAEAQGRRGPQPLHRPEPRLLSGAGPPHHR